jgi:hypothetical protein
MQVMALKNGVKPEVGLFVEPMPRAAALLTVGVENDEEKGDASQQGQYHQEW